MKLNGNKYSVRSQVARRRSEVAQKEERLMLTTPPLINEQPWSSASGALRLPSLDGVSSCLQGQVKRARRIELNGEGDRSELEAQRENESKIENR